MMETSTESGQPPPPQAGAHPEQIRRVWRTWRRGVLCVRRYVSKVWRVLGAWLSPSRGWAPGETTTWRARFAVLVRWATFAFALWVAWVVVSIFLYRFVDPPFSNLMMFRWLSGERVAQDWVSVERMSPQLVRAFVVSEDARFCQHMGVDFKEIENAISRSQNGIPRGASTISMQVAKNLYLWPSKSYLRKVLEVPITFLIELVWPKWRIFEVYANIAELGPGVFGVEAATQHHFRKHAFQLGDREAALLAVALPNPLHRDAGAPRAEMVRRAGTVRTRMRSAATACIEIRRHGPWRD